MGKFNEEENRMDLSNQAFSFLINQIVRTMGIDTVAGIDGDSHFIMAEGWYVSWPMGQESYVFIGFDEKMDANNVADLAMRFCKILDILNVQVFVDYGSDACDSTATIGFTATID